MSLRPYQQRSIDSLREQYAGGRRAPCLVLPTGGGKTHVAAEIIRLSIARGQQVLFAAHRTELISQSVSKLERAGVTNLRVIQAANDLGSRSAPVTVASIQTLASRRWADRLPRAGLVILDECHHTPARTWSGLAERYSGALLLGLTATPQRADGKSLGDIFDSIVIGATVRELVALDALVPCRIFAPLDTLESKHVAMSPVEAYRKHGENGRAIAFAVNVEHAAQIANEMTAAGYPSDVVHGGLSSSVRRDVLARFAHGELRCVASVQVLTEGFDDPSASVCILARKPQHAGLYLQIVGRVLRPAPGKAHATLIDLCGSVHDHGPPDLDREYTLDGRGIGKPDREAIRQCLTCGGVFRSGPSVCPLCGVELPRRAIVLPTALGVELVDVSKLPKLPPRPITLSITAKFPGTCRGCGRRIAVGQQIYWIKGNGARHVDCNAVEVAA